jgi:cellulose synthase/poly-beta-1,6-N-acetylglucosamine synthase-like glycosyltransferase
MSWHSWIRQLHRWISILFTATVVANILMRVMREGEPPAAVTYSPLLPLALLLLSGLYLFALPYTAKRRGGSRTD